MRVDWQTIRHHFFTRAFLIFLVKNINFNIISD